MLIPGGMYQEKTGEYDNFETQMSPNCELTSQEDTSSASIQQTRDFSEQPNLQNSSALDANEYKTRFGRISKKPPYLEEYVKK